ncbi:hypothetical protein [Chryseobacterium cucumeris]
MIKNIMIFQKWKLFPMLFQQMRSYGRKVFLPFPCIGVKKKKSKIHIIMNEHLKIRLQSYYWMVTNHNMNFFF